MEVECPRHWQPAPRSDCSHGWQIQTTQPWAPTQKGRRVRRVVGGTTQKLCLNVEWRYNKHKGSTHMWTTEDHWLHRLTSTSSVHALVLVNKQTQQNARELRPLMDALAQVPHKTPLSMKERWHWRVCWCVCITIPQTLKGTQMLFVANYIKLDWAALKTMKSE